MLASILKCHILHVGWDWLISTSYFPAAKACMPSAGVHFVGHLVTVSLGMVGDGKETKHGVTPHSVGAGGVSPCQVLWLLVCHLCKKHQLFLISLALFSSKEVCCNI